MSEDVRQMSDEIKSVIRRYSAESDVTIGEAIGALEIIKMKLLCENTNMEDEEA